MSKIYGGSGSHAAKSGQEYQQTDSESELDQRSLELASSHTSDEEDPIAPVVVSSSSTQDSSGRSYSLAAAQQDYNTAVPPLHVNTAGGAGLQVSDQPRSAQNTLSRHPAGLSTLSHRWSDRTTSDNNDPAVPHYYHGYPSPASEPSSEDKYVAMSPPHLLHQSYQQYSTSYSTSTDQQTSDLTAELQHIDSHR